MRPLLRIVGFGLVGVLVAACGGDSAGDPDAAGGSAPAPVGGSGNAGSGAGGTNSGTGGAATGGTNLGGSVAQCQGTFGASQTLFSFGNTVASSLSITADELELFYVDVPWGGTAHNISVLKRSSRSAAFSDPTLVSEVQATCAAENYPALDVSDDGLRMYFTCLDGPAPLRRATRTSRSAAWVVDADALGTVGDSITISGDELTAAAVRELSTNPRPDVYVRATTAQSFGSTTLVSGVQDSFMNPDLSSDGRVLFGVVRTAEAARIGFVTLDDALAATALPSMAGMPTPPAGAATNISDDYTPTLTPDCRSIYFLRAIRTGSSGTPAYTIEYAQR